jgi:YfiH family protein
VAHPSGPAGLPLLRPDWRAPAGVQVACSVREGGISAAPFDSLNLGDHVGDEPAAVAVNRERYARALGVRPVYLQQVHGSRVARLDAQSPDGMQADACLTTEPGVACTIMVADCLPVLLASADGRVVAAAHAGWRGLAGADGHGVLEALWASFWPLAGSSSAGAAAGAQVWLGPCIGPTAFEVGPEVKEAFEATDAAAATSFRPHGPGKWLADLPALARGRLRALGLEHIQGNDGSTRWCTVSDASRFFSHRRDRVSGRFAASIWLG